MQSSENTIRGLPNVFFSRPRNYDRSQRVDLLNKALELVPGFREALFWRGILHFDTVTHNIEDLRQVLSKTATDSSQYYVAMCVVE
jgi:hypothetical protein